MSWENRLQRVPKALIGGAVIQAIEEIDKSCPGAICDHVDEVCEIFSQAIRKHKQEAPAALIAKNLAFVQNLQRLAAAQEEREMNLIEKAPVR